MKRGRGPKPPQSLIHLSANSRALFLVGKAPKVRWNFSMVTNQWRGPVFSKDIGLFLFSDSVSRGNIDLGQGGHLKISQKSCGAS